MRRRFGEGHNSAGVVTTGTDVTITYLREGASPVVKTYTVPATSRFNVDVRSVVPEIADNSTFGAVIEVTNAVPIAVERSLYWDANGVCWAGGRTRWGR